MRKPVHQGSASMHCMPIEFLFLIRLARALISPDGWVHVPRSSVLRYQARHTKVLKRVPSEAFSGEARIDHWEGTGCRRKNKLFSALACGRTAPKASFPFCNVNTSIVSRLLHGDVSKFLSAILVAELGWH
ncbi:hypothetical protein B0H21DRAFT_219056 [Amylocystis lapponica]|nr:hypothetical protein B0H21DRAFT_219056 [Amylocystis lapponica]